MLKVPKLTEKTLSAIGLRKKDLSVYLTLVKLGTAPLRKIAGESELNRGTTYDALKRLIDLGLVSFVDSKTHRFFTAEDPKKLTGVATRKEVAVQEARLELQEIIPQLQELLGWSEHRPSVRYYEGEVGVRDLLEDILKTCAHALDHMYRVYSSAGIRDLILHAWPGFTKTRIQKKIRVKAIAIGEGGRTFGFDERRWLSHEQKSPTYIFIYQDETAYISVDRKQELFGVVIEDEGIALTQTMIFDSLWKHLN
jgi:sugar-specific transcriptional regulator TrmB